MRLRDLLLVHGSSATYLVDRLVDAGWVVREPDPHDRRVSMVVLTAPGRAVLERGIHDLVASGFGPIGKMDQAGRRELSRLLAELRGVPVPRIGEVRVRVSSTPR